MAQKLGTPIIRWLRYVNILAGGWPTPLTNMKVNWDDDIASIWKNKSHVPNYQPDQQNPDFSRLNR